MSNKIHVGLVFGGRSAEHEISILSARNVFEAIDRSKFDVSLFGIDKNGAWYHYSEDTLLSATRDPNQVSLEASDQSEISFTPERANKNVVSLSESDIDKKIDVVFPILHGPYGEDGSAQGFFKTLNIPFVGPGVLGSAVAMDKDVSKRLLRDAGIPVADYVLLNPKSNTSYEALSGKLGETIFVKPANMGSSVGVSRATDKEEFDKALAEAFKYDSKVIVEECIKGREIECAVLGNEDPKSSCVGEVITEARHGFYSYDAKYVDESGASTIIPANIQEESSEKIRSLAVKAFQALCCEGMGRVDFFLTDKGDAYLNEINTIPGFTNISMYPKLWEASGIGYTDLISELIMLAIERHRRESALSVDA